MAVWGFTRDVSAVPHVIICRDRRRVEAAVGCAYVGRLWKKGAGGDIPAGTSCKIHLGADRHPGSGEPKISRRRCHQGKNVDIGFNTVTTSVFDCCGSNSYGASCRTGYSRGDVPSSERHEEK